MADFYETNPHQADSIQTHADNFSFRGDRNATVKLLKAFNASFDVDEATLKNIDRLDSNDALTIVTGQQLGIYGGPLYTMFKILSAIALARQYEEKLDRPVVPVFWLADEDHDYEEVRTIKVLNGYAVKEFSLPPKNGNTPAVADMPFPEQLQELHANLRSTLIETDFSSELWNMLEKCFNPEHTFKNGFGQFIAKLFSKYGLVLAGSNTPKIKNQLVDSLTAAVTKSDSLRDALEEQSAQLEQQFHRQVTLYDSHLFYLHPNEGRLKIKHDGDSWITASGKRWSDDALVDEIQSAPEMFSPDVFLRPVLQDQLLPTLGYVAGPGEIGYYGQMKSFYRCFDQHMPVIFPRFSGTFVEPSISRIIKELPFEIDEYHNRIEDLESEFVERTEQTDIKALFANWKDKMQSISATRIDEITGINESLHGAAKKTEAAFLNELDELQAKTYRSVKKREDIQLKRIRRIQQNLFPQRELQERTLGAIYYMNKFGLDIWDRLLNKMEGQSLDSHKLIYL